MNYAYIRFSTEKQEETQQVFALTEYAATKGLTIDVVEKDEGVSGGVSYKDRKLAGLVKRLTEGDVLLVTEISRLGRSMSDINKLVNDELVTRKARLIVTKMGIDLNCAKLTAVDQMLLYAFSFSAQLEKEMTQQRTQSAIDDRKERIRRDGGFVSKAGNYVRKLGREKGCDNTAAGIAAGLSHTKRATSWRDNSPLYMWVTNQILRGRPRKDILEEAVCYYEKDPSRWGTRKGKALCAGTLSRWAKEIRL